MSGRQHAWETASLKIRARMRINADTRGGERGVRLALNPGRSLIMEIGKICNRNVVTAREVDEITSAAQLMREKHIGYLVVVKPNIVDGTVTPVGVITDRDIVVAVVAREIDPRSLTVGDVMTRQPAVVEEGSSVSTALRLMRQIGVRRLPVIGRAGMLVGVLSLDDVLDALAGELMDIAGSIRQEIKMEDALRP
jgi:CBS domain-containing protein